MELTLAFAELFEPERSDTLENSRDRIAETGDGLTLIPQTLEDAKRLVEQFQAKAERLCAERAAKGPQNLDATLSSLPTGAHQANGQSQQSESVAARVMQLLQLYEGEAESSALLKNVSHDDLVVAFNRFLFYHGAHLGISGWGDNIQSMRDGGVDSAWHFELEGRRGKLGVQIKSSGDVDHPTDTLHRTVLAQIAESRKWACRFCLLGSPPISPAARILKGQEASWPASRG
jgi:hypothetical protein